MSSRKMAKKLPANHKCFYVTASQGEKRYLVAGPYVSHEVARILVREVGNFVASEDPQGRSMLWGTASSMTPQDTVLGPHGASPHEISKLYQQ